jgi:hypothetical protein
LWESTLQSLSKLGFVGMKGGQKSPHVADFCHFVSIVFVIWSIYAFVGMTAIPTKAIFDKGCALDSHKGDF